jgi:AraC-like DNA-binding protein
MIIELDFLRVVDILSCVSAFMLGILFIFSIPANKKANVFLGLFLLSLSLEVYWVLAQSIVQKNILIPATSLATIPFLLLYINQTINKHIKTWYYLIFIPGIIVNVAIYNSLNTEFISYFEYVFNISILILILYLLKSHKHKVNNYYSDLENITLRWIYLIVYIFLGFHIFWIIEDIVGYQNESIIEVFAGISTILTFVMVLWIGHNGFSQNEIFKQSLFNFVLSGSSSNNNHFESTVYQNDDDNNHDNELFINICLQLESEKLYQDTKLNLRTLSQSLNIKEKELSRLINQQSDSNFYMFINQFRVEEFKKLINSSKALKMSITGLAQEAGFNSKSTFYTAFKTLEGITPKQYEDSLKKSE